MCNSAFINKVSLKFPNFREAKKNWDEWYFRTRVKLETYSKIRQVTSDNNHNDFANNNPYT